MILLSIFIVIWCFVALIMFGIEMDPGKTKICTLLSLLALIVFVVGGFFYIKSNTEFRRVELDKFKIYSLERESNVSGEFILGTGSIESKQYLVFAKDLGLKGLPNSYTIEKLSATDVRIHEWKIMEDGPDIVTTALEPQNFKWYWPNYLVGSMRKELNVPVGTLIRAFKL